MNELAIIGAGGFGREVALMISQINLIKRNWDVVGFFDDGLQRNSTVDGLRVIGKIEHLNTYTSPLSAVVAIADPNKRQQVVNRISNRNIDFPSIVHPSVNIGSSGNLFEEGTIICAGTILTVGVHLGRFSIVNLSCTIGHDVNIGNFCSLMPGCNISGNINIRDFTLVGTGVQVIQNLSIGSNCIIGAGSVVTHNIPSNQKVAGIPARLLH